jgi:hypothetical protein
MMGNCKANAFRCTIPLHLLYQISTCKSVNSILLKLISRHYLDEDSDHETFTIKDFIIIIFGIVTVVGIIKIVPYIKKWWRIKAVPTLKKAIGRVLRKDKEVHKIESEND